MGSRNTVRLPNVREKFYDVEVEGNYYIWYNND